MSYGDLIRDAFRVTWRNKFLWFFGFFVGGGVGSGFNAPANLGGQSGSFDTFGARLPGWLEQNLVVFLVLAVTLALVLAIVFVVLAIISSGSLADGVAAIDRGEERRFSATWRAGAANFWRVLGQGILFFLMALGIIVAISLIVGLVVTLGLAVTDSTGLRVLIIAPVIFVAVVLAIVLFVSLYIVGHLALRELVVGGGRIGGSIGAAYSLYRRNLGKSLLLWLIQVALGIGIGIATLLVVLILGLILIGPAVALFFADQQTAGVVAGVVGGVLFLVPFVLITAAIGTFNHAYWTLAYLRLTAQPSSPEPAPEGRAT